MKDKKKIKQTLEYIEDDLPVIEAQLKHRNGSSRLFFYLRTKYMQLIPEVIEGIQYGGHMSIDGEEFDYTPELKKLKISLEVWYDLNNINENNGLQT